MRNRITVELRLSLRLAARYTGGRRFSGSDLKATSATCLRRFCFDRDNHPAMPTSDRDFSVENLSVITPLRPPAGSPLVTMRRFSTPPPRATLPAFFPIQSRISFWLERRPKWRPFLTDLRPAPQHRYEDSIRLREPLVQLFLLSFEFDASQDHGASPIDIPTPSGRGSCGCWLRALPISFRPACSSSQDKLRWLVHHAYRG